MSYLRWLTLGSGRTNHERVSSVEARLGAKGAVHQLAQVGHSATGPRQRAARLLHHAIALVGRDAGRTTHFSEQVRTLPRLYLKKGERIVRAPHRSCHNRLLRARPDRSELPSLPQPPAARSHSTPQRSVSHGHDYSSWTTPSIHPHSYPTTQYHHQYPTTSCCIHM